jgi:sigma-B regulation protein RsbU (phosphoserine phosphatase)
MGRDASKMAELNVVLVDAGGEEPAGLRGLESSGLCRVKRIGQNQGLIDSTQLRGADAVLIAFANGDRPWCAQYDRLLEQLHASRVGTLVIDGPAEHVDRGEPSLVDGTPGDIPAEELWGRITTMARYRPLLERIERELSSMERLGKRLNRHFVEVDQELRLASRLQQDFLPRELPQVGPVRFGSLYRPAGFVSGDVYDVARVDENHIAFYVADVMGHGVPAGLLTMIIKQAVTSKRIDGGRYDLISPSETMASLNEVLAAQELPNCQFVTACYGLLDCRTLELQLARAGHPYPVRISENGALTELKSEGGLLGVFRNEEYATRTIKLQPGDKVLIVSDGLEAALPDAEGVSLAASGYDELRSLLTLPLERLIASLADLLDQQEGSLDPRDDVTVVALEVESAPAATC